MQIVHVYEALQYFLTKLVTYMDHSVHSCVFASSLHFPTMLCNWVPGQWRIQGGALGPTSFISCSFWQKCCQLIGWSRNLGNSGSATDWDRTIVCQFSIGNSQSVKGTVIAARQSSKAYSKKFSSNSQCSYISTLKFVCDKRTYNHAASEPDKQTVWDRAK